MSSFDKLVTYFEKFPGVGIRQARRFTYHLLKLRPQEIGEISELIKNLSASVGECHDCHRFFTKRLASDVLCDICSNHTRNHQQLLIVANDSDITALERSGLYHGYYFVLGGLAPLLETKNNNRLRSGALKALVEKKLATDLREVILGFAVSPDGENTGRYVRSLLNDYHRPTGEELHFSELGRGLSTGSELEYADPETLKNALRNRT